MLSPDHAKRHIKEWTGKWRKSHGDNGLTLNVISVLLNEAPEMVLKLLEEIDYHPFLCMNIKAPVWIPFKPSGFGKMSSKDAVAWSEARVRALALELAQKHPGCGFRNGEPRKEEVWRVAGALKVRVPEKPLSDKTCHYCKDKERETAEETLENLYNAEIAPPVGNGITFTFDTVGAEGIQHLDEPQIEEQWLNAAGEEPPDED